MKPENKIRPMFLLTKLFTAGILQGLTYTSLTCVPFFAGQRVDKPIGGSPYVILIVERL
jgi:hypothetical protein